MSLPISVVIATRNRSAVLDATLHSFLKQSPIPQEFIIADHSDDEQTLKILEEHRGQFEEVGSQLIHLPASHTPGAAPQRNTGTSIARKEYVLYADDDILLETDCLAELYASLEDNPAIGAVSSMITNQPYEKTGILTSGIIRLLGGTGDQRDGGHYLSGIRNVLPVDEAEREVLQQVEWLNTTCTLYRKEALPSPPFPPHFTGASVCEDVALSQIVRQRGWQLANNRLARIFHDSQGGDHKDDLSALVSEEFRNRAYVLRVIRGQRGLADLLRLLLSQGYQAVAGGLATRSIPKLCQGIRGIFIGLLQSRLQNLPPHYAPPK